MSPLAKTAPVEAKIMLQSGSEFDILNPYSSNFNIEDIAHGLSLLCRYVGQCNKFYSIAEHSIYVSKICSEHALEGLLHDAAEAFIGDVSGPLKALLPAYKNIERDVEAAIFQRFGVPYPLPKAVKAADWSVLAAEQNQIMPHGTNHWLVTQGVIPANISIQCLDPCKAKAAFMERFEYLSKRRNSEILRVLNRTSSN